MAEVEEEYKGREKLVIQSLQTQAENFKADAERNRPQELTEGKQCWCS